MVPASIPTAVIGCGAVSEIYLENLKNRFQIIDLVACADRNDWKVRQKAEKWGIKAMTPDEAIKSPEIEMIVNLTSPAGHFEISKASLAHKKHVYSEKTLALTVGEAAELLRLAEQNNLRIGCAPDTFLGGGIQTAKYIIDKGLIGKPLSAVYSINKNFKVYGDILPHLGKAGGSLLYDTGCYGLTALSALFGPVQQVSAFSAPCASEYTSVRIDRPWFGEKRSADSPAALVGILRYGSGFLATVHVNEASLVRNQSLLTIYGTEGMLDLGDPDRFGSPVWLHKNGSERFSFPFTHGFTENSRGLGAAEMAWAIRNNRDHRASGKLAFHVLEQMEKLMQSAQNGSTYTLTSSFEIPRALPEGFIKDGSMSPLEESALI